jgi:hypothetical protein
MQIGEAGEAGDGLVQPRIVLHRARAERIDAHVDGVILLAETDVVAHGVRLGEAGQADRRLASVSAEAVALRVRHVDVDARRFQPSELEEERLFDGERTIAGEGLALRPDGRGACGAALVVH